MSVYFLIQLPLMLCQLNKSVKNNADQCLSQNSVMFSEFKDSICIQIEICLLFVKEYIKNKIKFCLIEELFCADKLFKHDDTLKRANTLAGIFYEMALFSDIKDLKTSQIKLSI